METNVTYKDRNGKAIRKGDKVIYQYRPAGELHIKTLNSEVIGVTEKGVYLADKILPLQHPESYLEVVELREQKQEEPA